jgi:NitT/TauT family transport system permease protein
MARLGEWASALLALGLCLVWELAVRFGLADPVLVSSPSRIAIAARRLLAAPALGADLVYSLQVFVIAITIAALGGAALGLWIGWSRLAHRLLHPIVVALNAVPKIALMPLIVLWFGIGRPAGVFLAALMASFPVIIATSVGLSALEREHVLVARAFGAGRMLTLRSVILPGVLPYLVSGLRVGVSYALVGLLIAEFFASSRGIGYRMIAYMSNFEVDAFFVCLLLIAGFALGCTAILRALEARMQAWRADALARDF